MPISKTKNNNKTNNKRNNNKRRQKTKPRARRRTGGALVPIVDILPSRRRVNELKRFLNDPCIAPMPRGIFGTLGNTVLTIKASYSDNSTFPAGLMVYVPSFACNPAQDLPSEGTLAAPTMRACNLWRFSGDANVNPTLTGMSAIGGFLNPNLTWNGISDPGATYVNDTGPYSLQRLIGGCMKMRYIGSSNHGSGEVCTLVSTLMDIIPTVTSGPTPVLPSVDQIFNASGHIQRIGSGVELKFRPADNNASMADGYIYDAVAPRGVQAYGSAGTTINPPCYVIAYRGLTSLNTLADLVFEISKTSEYHHRVNTNLLGALGAQVISPPFVLGPPIAKEALEELDAAKPGWDYESLSSGISNLAEAVFKGGNAVLRHPLTHQMLQHSIKQGL